MPEVISILMGFGAGGSSPGSSCLPLATTTPLSTPTDRRRVRQQRGCTSRQPAQGFLSGRKALSAAVLKSSQLSANGSRTQLACGATEPAQPSGRGLHRHAAANLTTGTTSTSCS